MLADIVKKGALDSWLPGLKTQKGTRAYKSTSLWISSMNPPCVSTTNSRHRGELSSPSRATHHLPSRLRSNVSTMNTSSFPATMEEADCACESSTRLLLYKPSSFSQDFSLPSTAFCLAPHWQETHRKSYFPTRVSICPPKGPTTEALTLLLTPLSFIGCH